MGTTTNFQLRYPASTDTVDIPGDMQDLAVDTDKVLAILANVDVFTSMGGCSVSTTSGSYVDITGASKSFTKIGSSLESDLIVTVGVGGFVTAGGTGFKVGVNVNATDRDASWMLFNNSSQHLALPMGAVRITGLPAGTYTVKLRALRTSGTGTVSIDTNDTVTFTMQERAI